MQPPPDNSTKEVMKRVRKNWCALFAFLVGSCVAVFSIAGLIPSAHIVCEVGSHYYLQYFALLSVSIVVLLLCRHWKAALFLSPFFAFCAIQLAPYYIPAPRDAQPELGRLKIVQINLNSKNRQYAEVINYLKATDPDIVSFEEFTQKWSDEMTDALKDLYPYRFSKPLENNFGIGIFSKIPFDSTKLVYLANYDFPTIIANIKVNNQPVSVVCTHTLPPPSESCLEGRRLQMISLGQIKENKDHRVLIMGDLNCSCWNPDFRKMLESMEGIDSQVGFGVQCSWPSFFPLMSTNIDHLVTTNHFRTVQRKLGPFIGSDHLPVYAEEVLIK